MGWGGGGRGVVGEGGMGVTERGERRERAGDGDREERAVV